MTDIGGELASPTRESAPDRPRYTANYPFGRKQPGPQRTARCHPGRQLGTVSLRNPAPIWQVHRIIKATRFGVALKTPELFIGGVHGDDEAKVYAELCHAVRSGSKSSSTMAIPCPPLCRAQRIQRQIRDPSRTQSSSPSDRQSARDLGESEQFLRKWISQSVDRSFQFFLIFLTSISESD
jgi:hypothetical protein